MGTFVGHALPGSLFLIMSFWWSSDCFNLYFKTTSKRKSAKLSVVDYNFDFMTSHNKLLQGLFVMTVTIIGMIGEYLTAFDNGPVMCKDNLQHISMYFFFFVCGLSYFLSYCGAPLPPDAEHFTMTLSFFGETLLFYFHLHGRSHLDIHVHTLLIIVTSLCTICSCYEWKYKDNFMASLGRPFWTTVQGTWFWQIGFILYNPLPNAKKWDPHNHDQIMTITSMFCWHIVGTMFLFMFLCFRYNRKYKNIWDVSRSHETTSTSAKYRQLQEEEQNLETS